MSAQPAEQHAAPELDTPATGLSRRSLIARGAVGGLGVVLAGSLDSIFGAGAASAAPGNSGYGPTSAGPGYGPLIDDPAGRLALPRGFSYTVVAETGVTELETGEPTPADPDGTASFPNGTGVVLVNNHEISSSGADTLNPVPHRPGLTYDTAVFGGTTTIEVDRHGNRVREYVSLAGTDNNCAGGKTPWNTWLTCEETENKAGVGGRQHDHGYVFEVDPYSRAANQDPQPIKALGRYPHEAVVVDPDEFRLYLTEDASGPNGLFYRYTPPAGARPLGQGSLKRLGPTDGTLEAMYATTTSGTFVPDLSVASQPGTTYRVTWKTVPDRDARTVSTRKQFDYTPTGGTPVSAPGGDITRSRKLEGAWWASDGRDGAGTYFVASFARTSDGSARQHDGQVWFLDPKRSTITLELVFAYTPDDQDDDVDGPDNITVSPFGGVIIAEDGDGVNHLVGATPSGQAYFLARNQLAGDSEFTGPNFAPNNDKLLFANVQTPGHVYAIRGPWKRV